MKKNTAMFLISTICATLFSGCEVEPPAYQAPVATTGAATSTVPPPPPSAPAGLFGGVK